MKMILAFLFFFARADLTTQKIEVSPTGGGPGINIDIKGPAVLLERLKNCKQQQFRGGNNGITLDWGDGTKVQNNANILKDCKEYLSHEFSRMGKYTIKILLTKAGPTDGIEKQWLGEATITVTPGGK